MATIVTSNNIIRIVNILDCCMVLNIITNNLTIIILLISGTSLMYNVYSNEESLLPCMTEHSSAGNISDSIESIDTYWYLLDKKDSKTLRNFPLIP